MNRELVSILEKVILLVIGILLFYTTVFGLYTMNVPEDVPHFLQIGLTALTLAVIYVGLQIKKLAEKMGNENSETIQQ